MDYGPSTVDDPYTFTGREYDPESGLYYYRARYYDPRLGRFLQEDPVKGFLRIPQSLNLYSYVYNNPINYIDPDGEILLQMILMACGGIVFGVIFIGIGYVVYLEILWSMQPKSIKESYYNDMHRWIRQTRHSWWPFGKKEKNSDKKYRFAIPIKGK